MEKKYGILWTDRGGEYNFTHAYVIAQIATKVAQGYTGEMWLKNHYGQNGLVFEQDDKVYARIEVVTADTCELSDEEFAALTFPVLRIAMPRGRFKMYYPLAMRDNFS